MVYRWRYSQYGATSCFSCRTFYRRSVEAKAFKNYKCRSKTEVTGECDINVQSRFDPPPLYRKEQNFVFTLINNMFASATFNFYIMIYGLEISINMLIIYSV